MMRALKTLMKTLARAIRRTARRVAHVVDGLFVGWQPTIAEDTFDESDYEAVNDNDEAARQAKYLAATFARTHEGHGFVAACRQRLDGMKPVFNAMMTDHDKAWILGASTRDLMTVRDADPMTVYNWLMGSETAMPGLERPSQRAVRLSQASVVEEERQDMQSIMRKVMRRMAAAGNDDPDPDEVERLAYEEIERRRRRFAAAS